jgi:hypothetical protein
VPCSYLPFLNLKNKFQENKPGKRKRQRAGKKEEKEER